MSNEDINLNEEQINKSNDLNVPNKYSDPNEIKKGDDKYLIKDTENSPNHSFLNDKIKEENFISFENRFLQFIKNEGKKEYNIQELVKTFDNLSKPEDVNKVLESLPKEVIMEITKDSQNYKAINLIKEWQQKIGGQIASFSNKRIDYFDNSNKKEIIKLGTIPEIPKDYLEITSNASRFAPREVSETFIKDAVDVFLDKNKLVGSGMTSFLADFNQKSALNIVRNLCESGYKDEAKKLLLESLKEETKININDRFNYGNSNLIFSLAKENIFSPDEVKEILDKSGYLEEKKEEVKNTGWQ